MYLYTGFIIVILLIMMPPASFAAGVFFASKGLSDELVPRTGFEPVFHLRKRCVLPHLTNVVKYPGGSPAPG